MPPEQDGVESRGKQPSYVRGGSSPRPNPLTFYVPLLTGKVPHLCYTGTLFMHLVKTLNLTESNLTIVNAPSFHIYKTPNQEEFSGGSSGAPRSHLFCTKANLVPRAVPSKNWWGGKRGKSPGDEVVPK